MNTITATNPVSAQGRKTMFTVGAIRLTSEDFFLNGSDIRMYTDYVLSGEYFGRRVNITLGSNRMPWQEPN